VPLSDAPTGYAVVGINNASGVRRQAANYAIPIATVRDFINTSFARQSANEKRRKLEIQVDAFIKGLDSNKSVYSHIARYLSNECVASSAEFAIAEVEKRANRTVQNDIFDKYILDALDYSVAWTIEDQMRSVTKSVVLHTEKGKITMNVDGTWTVPLVFGDKTMDTIWVNEYGMWRIKSAGGLTGDKAAMQNKTATEESKKEDSAKLRVNYNWEFFANYMYFGMRSSNPRGNALALMLDVRQKSGLRYGAQLVSDFGEFGIAQVTAGYIGAIKINGKVAIMPFGDMGFGISWFEEDAKDPKDYYGPESIDMFGKAVGGISFTGGLMVRTAAIPGLTLRAAYQFNWFDPSFLSKDERFIPLPDIKHSFLIGVGYAL
jgi:hypothetical protein